jgi:hypothetical protein
MAHEEESLPGAVPIYARNGRWIGGKPLRCCTQSGLVVIPPEPPVVVASDAERPAAVKGAPGVGAA